MKWRWTVCLKNAKLCNEANEIHKTLIKMLPPEEQEKDETGLKQNY